MPAFLRVEISRYDAASGQVMKSVEGLSGSISPSAVRIAEDFGQRGFGALVCGAVQDDRISDMLAITTGALSAAWEAHTKQPLTPDALWLAIGMDDLAKMPEGIRLLREFVLQLMGDLQRPEEDGAEKNAPTRTSAGGRRSATSSTGTSKSATRKRRGA